MVWPVAVLAGRVAGLADILPVRKVALIARVLAVTGLEVDRVGGPLSAVPTHRGRRGGVAAPAGGVAELANLVHQVEVV